ncbi:unnamed protein product [Parajaminaea phylloscopi]
MPSQPDQKKGGSGAESSRILSTKQLDTGGEFKWTALRSIQWRDPSGKERRWETMERPTRKGQVDAVAVLTLITRPSSRDNPEVLLVSQFRPPVKVSADAAKDDTTGLVLELPAGLVDAGESPREAAMRELKEETGYGGGGDNSGENVQVLEESRIMYSDPGCSTTNMTLVSVKIDLERDDAPEPVAEPDEGEFIEKRTIPLKSLYSELKRLQAEEKYAVDARLLHLAYGVQLRELFGLDKSQSGSGAGAAL